MPKSAFEDLMEKTIDYKKYLLHAYEQATKSPDPSTQNGSVLVRANTNGTDQIIGEGFTTPVGPYSKELLASNRSYRLAVTMHAEVASIIAAGRDGHPTRGAILFCPWSACRLCANIIRKAEIAVLVRHKQLMEFSAKERCQSGYPGWSATINDADVILRDAGIRIVEYDGKLNGPVIRHSQTEFKP